MIDICKPDKCSKRKLMFLLQLLVFHQQITDVNFRGCSRCFQVWMITPGSL